VFSNAHGILTAGGGAALSSHQRDSNPCFSLERVVTRLVNTGTYGTIATGGCHDAFKFEWFVSQAVQTLSPAG
jgi:hypothetical protein